MATNRFVFRIVKWPTCGTRKIWVKTSLQLIDTLTKRYVTVQDSGEVREESWTPAHEQYLRSFAQLLSKANDAAFEQFFECCAQADKKYILSVYPFDNDQPTESEEEECVYL